MLPSGKPVAVWLLGAVLAVGCAAQPPAEVPGSPGSGGTPTDNSPSIVATPLTTPEPGRSVIPVGSPALTGNLPVGRLLFDSDRSGNLDIWYLEAGASEPVQLTTDPGSDRVAAWHPNGESAIFASDRLGGPSVPSRGALRAYGLFIAYLDDRQDEHLLGTRTFNHGARWSPDGGRIVFYSDATGETQVYLLDPDYEPNTGNEPVALTSDGHNDGPAWSPDGSRIAFNSLRDGNREIYVMDADGSNQRRLTDDPADDFSPAWSPDGSLIAFHSERNGGRHIFVMNADGSAVRQLTEGEVRDGFASWSPDGEWIAFDRQLGREDSDILAIRADGSELIHLTSGPERDAFPDWGR